MKYSFLLYRLVRRFISVSKRMFSGYYTWGKFSIEKNKHHPWLWDLCLNGAPLQKGYEDPNQAAFDAHQSDVGDKVKNSILKKYFAPSDLRQWSESPNKHFRNNQQNN